MSSQAQIVLASASPRRAELLDQIGVRYRVEQADIDETPRVGESASSLVQRLAKAKAQAVSSELPVLGADTLGVLDGELLLQPRNFQHARQMLGDMSGSWHEILSAVALSYQGNTRLALNRSRVLFKTLSEAEIIAYWDSGEPRGKAGAYAIQGLGALFIERIEGSYSAIMGLPLFETGKLLENTGIHLIA